MILFFALFFKKFVFVSISFYRSYIVNMSKYQLCGQPKGVDDRQHSTCFHIYVLNVSDTH